MIRWEIGNSVQRVGSMKHNDHRYQRFVDKWTSVKRFMVRHNHYLSRWKTAISKCFHSLQDENHSSSPPRFWLRPVLPNQPVQRSSYANHCTISILAHACLLNQLMRRLQRLATVCRPAWHFLRLQMESLPWRRWENSAAASRCVSNI